MTRLLSIDPGTNMGWAIFEYDGTLGIGGTERIPKDRDPEQVVHLWRTTQFVGQIIADYDVDRVVLEWPRIRARGKANPNNIMSLAGRCAAAAAAHPSSRTYIPDEWTRGVPKDVRHRRLLLKHPTILRPEKYLGTPGRASDFLDAFGLGLYALQDMGFLQRRER